MSGGCSSGTMPGAGIDWVTHVLCISDRRHDVERDVPDAVFLTDAPWRVGVGDATPAALLFLRSILPAAVTHRMRHMIARTRIRPGRTAHSSGMRTVTVQPGSRASRIKVPPI